MVYIRMIIGVLIAIGVLAGMFASVQAQSDEGLVAEWHFDEGSGSVLKDSSGNGNDGVIYGATWIDGKYGKALSFDGVDDYVYCGNDRIFDFGTNTFTIETWVKTIDKTTSNWEGIVGKWDTPNGYFLQYISSTGAWAFGWHGNTYLNPSKSISDGNWHHVVAKRTGLTSAQLYIDGEFIGSRADLPSISSDTPNPLSIGRLSLEYGRYFNGIIDEVRIYNRALTSEEIRLHYEQKPNSLTITKSASPYSIKQGQTSTITLTVKNAGTTELKDIEVSDTYPSYLIFVDGEISKTYASMKPQDLREFQYTIQLNEAGTFNLDSATATYADEKGNYHTVKSKPTAIEVISSPITTTNHLQAITSSDAQTASVNLHGEKTDVVLGEDVLLKLSAVNIIGNPTMHVQVIIIPPSGWSVTSSEFAKSGAGQYTTIYELESGGGKDIEVRIVPNQIGDDFQVEGRIIYYFGDDLETREDHTLSLPIKVRAEPDDGEKSNADSEESKTPGFGVLAAGIGLLVTAYLVGRK